MAEETITGSLLEKLTKQSTGASQQSEVMSPAAQKSEEVVNEIVRSAQEAQRIAPPLTDEEKENIINKFGPGKGTN